MPSTTMVAAEQALQEIAGGLADAAAEQRACDGAGERRIRGHVRAADGTANAERDRELPVVVDEHGTRPRVRAEDVLRQRGRRREAHGRVDVAVEPEAALAVCLVA